VRFCERGHEVVILRKCRDSEDQVSGVEARLPATYLKVPGLT
jgi:hypothetical protein